jgi:putative ABC transport system permease protein
VFIRTSLYDLRLTLRHAGRAKAFYASAVLTLALGIAGATVMFTLVRGILLRPLPVPDENRLVVSWRVPSSGLATHVPYRSSDVEEIGRASRSFEKITGIGYNGAFDQDWRLGDVWITAKTVAVMGGFFDVTSVRPQIGRALTVEDDRSGAERMVVLSHSAWVRLFAAAPKAIGQTLYLQKHAFTVAGVMPPDFEYPGGSEIWTTLNALAEIDTNEAFRTGILRDVEILGRLRRDITVAQATDELAEMTADLDARKHGAAYSNLRP